MSKNNICSGATKQEAPDCKQKQEQHGAEPFKNILVLGSGGREHALAWKLAQSEGVKVFVAPGNAGTAQVGRNVGLKLDDFDSIRQCCVEQKIDLVVVGPEQPLVDGIVDFFYADKALQAVKIIGPDRLGARLEGSKAFAKRFMQKYGVPTAKCLTVNTENLAEGEYFLNALKPPYVLKADGLAAGKGVLIIDSIETAKNELRNMLHGKFGAASEKVVIEEFLSGIEVSVFVLTDGEHYVLLPEAKDYKRIGEGDTGLNTGGMGAVSPVPFCTDAFLKKVEERIVKPTLRGIRDEQMNYKGFIFIGLMNVDGEPYVIEYNVRMGDPETEAVMTRIDGDFVDVLYKCAQGRLREAKLSKNPKTALTVMMVSGGYPEHYRKGMVMKGFDELADCVAFHAGTTFDAEDRTVTSGGRVLAITALGDTIEQAREKAYRNVEKMSFDDANYRRDIGVDLMNYR